MKRKPDYIFLWSCTIVLLICVLMSCGKRNHAGARAAFKGVVAPEINQQVLENQTLQFLDWYTSKVDSLVDIQLVDNSDIEDTGAYRINFDSTEAYLHILTVSDIFSKDYIDDKRDYFRLCDQQMRLSTGRDSIPYGLDADLILLSPEYDEDVFDFSKAIFSNYIETENGASIDVTVLYTLRIDFVIQGERLVIDKIDVITTDIQDDVSTKGL